MSQVKIFHYALDTLPKEVHKRLCKLDTEWLHIHKAHQVDKGYVLTLESNGHIVGYTVVKHNDENSAHIHRLLIHSACRGNNFGKQLLFKAMSNAAKQHYLELYVECQKQYLDFFRSFGFILVREPKQHSEDAIYFMELPSLKYYLTLRREAEQERKPGKHVMLVGHDSQLYKYNTQEQFIDFNRSMLAQAQRQICILSDKITTPLFKEEYLRRSFLNLTKRNAQAKIKILLIDDRSGAGYHNHIIDLAQKLTSFIEIRVIQKGATKPKEMLTTVDFDAGIFRKDLDAYTGFANYNNHLIARRLRDTFEQHWQYAKPSANMRRLSI